MFAACFSGRTDVQQEEMPHCNTFDPCKSTEENYTVPHFTGIHASIRPLLDYTYHRKYIPQREKVQDDLIQRFMAACERPGNELLPWILFTAGAMGAGKGYVTRWMEQKGYLPMQNFLVVDPDAIRQALPEWKSYCSRDESTAGNLTQKEAGCIAELLGERGLRDRYNVIFDGSLRDTEWYTRHFQRLRRDFPGIRIMILHIVADREEVLQRAKERGEKTGRVVPVKLLEESMEQVPKSVDSLATEADFACRVVNRSGVEPYLERVGSAPFPPKEIDLSWDLVKSLWKDIDTNHDGRLSKLEVATAISQGILTQKALDTIDGNRDGSICYEEVRKAQEAARAASTRHYK